MGARIDHGAPRLTDGLHRVNWCLLGCFVGGLMIIFGSVVQWSESVVRDRLLDGRFYASTLNEQHVYQRVYSEVLVDPEVRELTDRLLGDFTTRGTQLADVTAVSNALLRLAVPPSALRLVAESVVNRVLAYVRGEVDELDATIDLSDAIGSINEAALPFLAEALSTLPRILLANLDRYEAQVESFAAALQRGEVPAAIPEFIGRGASASQIIDVIENVSASGLPDAIVDQVVAAVRFGNDVEALIAAAASFVRGHLLALTIDPQQLSMLQFDLIEVLGPRAGQPPQEVVDQVDSLRGWAQWLPGYVGVLAFILVGLGVALVVVCARRSITALIALSASFLTVGVTTWLFARTVSSSLSSPLKRAAAPSDANSLPRSIVGIVSDVDRSIADSLKQSMQDRVVAMLLVALALALAAGGMAAISWARGAHVRAISWACGALILIVGSSAAWLLVRGGANDIRECNGHAELCERRYDEVVQAATHNSMSSPDVVRIWPEHDGDIEAQLNFGIRTLLIDTHYWTQIARPTQLSTAELSLSSQLATYLFGELDGRLDARPGAFVCHARCAFGAIPLAETLNGIESFLVANPDEVVTLIVQDAVSVEDTSAALRAGGLDRYVYEGDPSDDWPTLGELIDDDTRLVMFAENSGPPPVWYRSAFDSIQDTDFHVPSPDKFTCELNRGTSMAPLLLLNHWVHRAAPDRADATIVNEADYIVRRAIECASVRGRLPNFVAVNFFSIGDVMEAVDRLNGV